MKNKITSLNFPKIKDINVRGGNYEQMRKTLSLIGSAIVNSSRYLPIRNRAASLATLAGPKDYLGQLNSIFNGFVKHWRYVKDPLGQELITTSPKQVFELVIGGKSTSPGVGLGLGAGDCDDATVAVGALLMSVGFPVRIGVLAPLGAAPGKMFSHVFPQAFVSGIGWITVDPVVFPKQKMGYLAPNSRTAFFNLSGNLINKTGNTTGLSGIDKGDKKMNYNNGTTPALNELEDLAGLGDYSSSEPLDFRKHGIKDYGIYAEKMGILDVSGRQGMSAEVEIDEDGKAWSPMLELAPNDYNHMAQVGTPYHGMLALGDTGDVYEWDQQLGFFKKLFRRAKKGLRKLAKRGKRLAKKLIRRLPGGKYLLRLGKKMWKIAKKLVKPLIKLVGPYAKYLAPIAALIPGVGPAVAAGIYATGKAYKIMKKLGVKMDKKKGKIGKMKFTSKKQQKAFSKALRRAARKQGPMSKQEIKRRLDKRSRRSRRRAA